MQGISLANATLYMRKHRLVWLPCHRDGLYSQLCRRFTPVSKVSIKITACIVEYKEYKEGTFSFLFKTVAFAQFYITCL